MAITAHVVHHPVRPEEVLRDVGGDDDGAVILFLGTVRNHNEGRTVRGMRYDAYEAMARETLEAIVAEARDEIGVERVAAVHRVGELEVGEISVAIAVSSPHRERAYQASRYVIEEIKKRLPVWKKEHYVDGSDAWVRGADPREAALAPGSREPASGDVGTEGEG